jgi:hypothetical protein
MSYEEAQVGQKITEDIISCGVYLLAIKMFLLLVQFYITAVSLFSRDNLHI